MKNDSTPNPIEEKMSEMLIEQGYLPDEAERYINEHREAIQLYSKAMKILFVEGI